MHLCDPAQGNLMLSLLKIWRHFRYTITLSVDYNDLFLFVEFSPDWVKNTLHFQLGNSKFPTWNTTNQFHDWKGSAWNKNDNFYLSEKFNMFQIIVQKSVSENFIEIRNVSTRQKIVLQPIPNEMERISFYSYCYDISVVDQLFEVL
ncbi:hypothetical protein RFI_37364, partial [Reticulomyxa filosa]